jgi:hypothetical protein
VTEGGPNGIPHPAYGLSWSFSKNKSSADPNGTISVSSAKPITMKLYQGLLTVKGTGTDGSPVSAAGTLLVRLTGTSNAPTLTITESGLTQAEHALGIVSPFDINGEAAVVPIKHTTTFRGC